MRSRWAPRWQHLNNVNLITGVCITAVKRGGALARPREGPGGENSSQVLSFVANDDPAVKKLQMRFLLRELVCLTTDEIY